MDEPVVTIARTDSVSLPQGFAASNATKVPTGFASTPSASPSPTPAVTKPVMTPGVKPPQTSPASVGSREKLLPQLYLIRGPIVSNPPQTFRGTFSPDGKAEVILAGNRRLTGNFESFALNDSISAKYKPALLVNPDCLKIPRGAHAASSGRKTRETRLRPSQQSFRS
jgi:hypothetical protein